MGEVGRRGWRATVPSEVLLNNEIVVNLGNVKVSPAPELHHPKLMVGKPVTMFWSPSSYLARLQPHHKQKR